MRKRNMKFMAMFLSLTMAFSMNTFAFGSEASLDEVPSEAVQAEVTEGEEPEIVKLTGEPSDGLEGYNDGFAAGVQAGEDDQALGSGKTDNYNDTTDGAKSDLYKNSEAYAAGFEDGYKAYAHSEFFSSYRAGFDQGYRDARAGLNTDEFMDAAKVKDADKWKYIEPLDEDGNVLKDQAYIDAYQSAYKKGVEIGKKAAAAATDARVNYVNTGLYRTWTTAEAYLDSKEYKDLIAEGGALFGKTTEYVNAWKSGFIAAYDHAAKENGLTDGKADAQADINFEPVSSYDTKEKAVEYIKKFSPANEDAYRVRWKTYNKKCDPETTGDYKGRQKAEADSDGDNIPVGNTYLEYYVKGYNAVTKSSYNVFGRWTNLKEKAAFNQGFAEGWATGVLDYGTDKDDNLKAAKQDGGLWYTYCETDKDIHTKGEIEQYQAGFEYAYSIAVSDAEGKGGQWDDGYNTGLASGTADANRDRYSGNPYDGFYEPSDKNSAYNVATGEWGKGYKAGYDEGYNDTINPTKKKAGNEVFDYTAAEMDPWRISSDPSTWIKAQLLVNQKDTAGTYNDTYLDTAGFADGAPNTHNPIFSDGVQGEIVATSPFQYYFDLYDTDHLIDKKTVSGNLRTINDVYVNENPLLRDGLNNGSVGEYLYAAFTTPSSNKAKKPKKGVSDNGATYVLVRYRLVGAETDENYMVRRYTYDKNHKESVVIDTINNYYQGTDQEGNTVNEPVVLYDSRKIAGVKPLKDDPEQHESNDKANRYIIDAEALVVTWQAGVPAKLIGKLDIDVKAKDNVNATVPHRYLEYLGEVSEIEQQMPTNEAGDNIPNAIEFVQSDRIDAAGAILRSKYYKVTKSNEDLTDGVRAVKESVALAGTKSAPKLSAPSKNGVDINGSNAYMNKKGASPSFTLKAKSKDPLLKPYMKDVKKALKKATFTFEISRMKLASDYISNADHNAIGLPGAGNRYRAYNENVEFEDTVLSKDLNDRFTPAPSRLDSGSDEAYKENVKKFEESFQALRDYASIDNKEFQDKARKEFEATVTALRNQYNEIKTKYGAKRDVLQAWIEDETTGWAAAHKNDIVFFGRSAGAVAVEKFPYKVTKVDRTGNGNPTIPVINMGIVIPVENSYAYKALVPEDLNCDGEITAVEHYLYLNHVTNGGGTVDDPWFKKVLEDGDNITFPNATIERLIKANIEFDTVTATVIYWDDNNNVVVGYPTKIGGINFNYHYDYEGAVDQGGNLGIALGHDAVNSPDTFGRYMYDFGANPRFDIYIDFLENRDLDIEIVENNANPGFHVLYPGTAEFADGDGNVRDQVEIYFTNPKLKVSKKAATLDVKPVLKLRVFDGWLNQDRNMPKPLAKNEKKLKAFTLKAGVSANTLKKLPKADVQMEQKMAETEPFIVATGINNFEGSIAIRQRKNGELGYGYFKDDDFYYIFSDED